MGQLIHSLLAVDIKVLYAILAGAVAIIVYIVKLYHKTASWIEEISKKSQDTERKIDDLRREINSSKELLNNIINNCHTEKEKISDVSSRVDSLMFISMIEKNQRLTGAEVIENIYGKKITA